MKKIRIGVMSVLPSPYQRDLLKALAIHESVQLSVYYQQRGAADSPWRTAELEEYERILPGWGFDCAGVRVQFNAALPEVQDADMWIINSALTSPAAQWMMRCHLRRKSWIFWGEQIRSSNKAWRSAGQNCLAGAIRGSSGVAAVGSRAVEDYGRRFPQFKIWNLPYHCDLAPFQSAKRLKLKKQEPVFLYCGQMIPRKGVDVLLKAFSGFVRQGGRGRLLLVGREGALADWMRGLPESVRTRIEYAGFKEPAELPDIFAQADIFVMPSRYDGWGVVVNQALGAGLAVLCSRGVGAGVDLVKPEKNGLIFPSDDVDALEAVMLRLANDPQMVEAMGAESAALAVDWSPRRGAEKWREIARETVGL